MFVSMFWNHGSWKYAYLYENTLIFIWLYWGLMSFYFHVCWFAWVYLHSKSFWHIDLKKKKKIGSVTLIKQITTSQLSSLWDYTHIFHKFTSSFISFFLSVMLDCLFISIYIIFFYSVLSYISLLCICIFPFALLILFWIV